MIPKRAKSSVVVDDDDDFAIAPPLRVRQERFVGERISVKRALFASSPSSSEDDEEEDEWLMGTCEAWSPSRKSFWVVFDEPFSRIFDRFPSQQDQQDPERAHRRRRLSRLSVAVWEDPSLYMTFDACESFPGAFGGTSTWRKGLVHRRSCDWFGTWVRQEDLQAMRKDEPIRQYYCLCFRPECAEAPPSFAENDDGGGDEDDSKEESVLVVCEQCEEWFHYECALTCSKKKKDLGEIQKNENWKCPLCDGSVSKSQMKRQHRTKVPLATIDPELSKRTKAWKSHTSQKQWRKNALLEWQYWPNTAPASTNENDGEWVFSVATLRRFLNKKPPIKHHTTAQQQPMGGLLNQSYPSEPLVAEDLRGEDLFWELRMDKLRQEQDGSDDSKEDDEGWAEGEEVSRGPVVPLTCSRTRPLDLHNLLLRGQQQQQDLQLRNKRNKQSSFTEDDVRNQRLNSRRVASAVGESIGQIIGRKRQLRFGRSRIHMWGVFADEPIAARDFVAEYMGEIISQQETDRRFADYMSKGMSDYLFKIDDELFCDATMKGSIARFINHSCEPNCEAKIVPHKNQKKIALYALRDIAVGEELCYDYKFPEEADESKIPCNCGARKCKKVMN